jgi:hypothetical protein
MRLRRWGRVAGDQGFALAATVDGRAGGFSFGWRCQEIVTMYELGVAVNDPAVQSSCYFELLVHGPVRLACAHGMTTIDLGLHAAEAKRLRGARAEEVSHWSDPREETGV